MQQHMHIGAPFLFLPDDTEASTSIIALRLRVRASGSCRSWAYAAAGDRSKLRSEQAVDAMAPDLVNGVLNWVGTPAMVASLLLFYPPYYLFKTCYSFLSWLFPEDDLAGKVVLITGASSGIGEVRWHTCTTQYCLPSPALRLLLSLTIYRLLDAARL